MVEIEFGTNVREMASRALAYLSENPTFGWWDNFWGTSIGSALTIDYALHGGRNPVVFLGLSYAGLLLNKTRGGMWVVALAGAYMYVQHVRCRSENKK